MNTNKRMSKALTAGQIKALSVDLETACREAVARHMLEPDTGTYNFNTVRLYVAGRRAAIESAATDAGYLCTIDRDGAPFDSFYLLSPFALALGDGDRRAAIIGDIAAQLKKRGYYVSVHTEI